MDPVVLSEADLAMASSRAAMPVMAVTSSRRRPSPAARPDDHPLREAGVSLGR